MRAPPSDVDAVLANGELFLVTAALAGAALGELVGVVRSVRQPFLELIAAGCCHRRRAQRAPLRRPLRCAERGGDGRPGAGQ
jgi:hypothetical protein